MCTRIVRAKNADFGVSLWPIGVSEGTTRDSVFSTSVLGDLYTYLMIQDRGFSPFFFCATESLAVRGSLLTRILCLNAGDRMYEIANKTD